MKRLRRLLLLGAALFLCGSLFAALVEPNQILIGMLCGDAFYDLRPTRYWREVLRADGERNQIGDETIAVFKHWASGIPVLRACARDADRNVRWPAVHLLGRVARLHVHECLPGLREALHDEDTEVRLQAIIALGNLQANALSAAADLVPLMKGDPVGQVRFMAEKALWHISKKMAVEATAWQLVESAWWGFTARFPAAPDEKQMPAALAPDQLTIYSFTAMHGVTHCTVAITEYPPELFNGTDEERLDAGRDLMLFGIGAKLVEETPFERGPIRGREITLEKIIERDGAANTFRTKSRIFWVGRRLYHVQAAYDIDLSVLPAVDFFLDSFALHDMAVKKP
jgi:hypothetical protein